MDAKGKKKEDEKKRTQKCEFQKVMYKEWRGRQFFFLGSTSFATFWIDVRRRATRFLILQGSYFFLVDVVVLVVNVVVYRHDKVAETSFEL